MLCQLDIRYKTQNYSLLTIVSRSAYIRFSLKNRKIKSLPFLPIVSLIECKPHLNISRAFGRCDENFATKPVGSKNKYEKTCKIPTSTEKLFYPIVRPSYP